ncbi:hypothetical protein GCM10027082_46000 [Comamonas humi]
MRATWALAAGGLTSVAAQAAIDVNHGFSPSTVIVGQPTTLTVHLINQNAAAATGTGVSIPLAGLNVTNLATTCAPGTVAMSGSDLVLTNGTLSAAPDGQCEITAQVSAPSAGTYVSDIAAGTATSSQGSNTSASSVALRVNALAPITGSKAFSPTTIRGGGTSTVSITLKNPNNVPLTNAALTDNLPARLVVANPANATTSCGGTVTAAPGAASASLAGGTITAQGACTLSFNVTPADPNVFFSGGQTNTIASNSVTADYGATNIAPFSGSATVTTGARILKNFVEDPVPNGGSARFTLLVQNFNATPLANVTFTDNVPAGIRPTAINGNSCNGTASFTDTSVSLSGGTVAGVSDCTIDVQYTPVNTTGNYITATNNQANFAPSPLQFGSVGVAVVGDSVTINPGGPGPGISVVKTFNGQQSVTDANAGRQTNTLQMVLTLSNSAAAPAAITSITDDLGLMGTSFSVGGPAGNTCGSTVNAPVGGSRIDIAGGAIPASGSCTVSVPIRIGGDATVGLHRNRIGGTSGQGDANLVIAGGGVWPNIQWAEVSASAALTAGKSFSPTTISSGQTTSTMTITLNRAAGATELTNVSFTDTFPGTPFVLEAKSLVSNSCGGTLDWATPGQLSLTGGTIPVPPAGQNTASSCTIVVEVGAPAGANGTITNSLPARSITTAEKVASNNGASASLTASSASLQLSKEFSKTTLDRLGDKTTLKLIISNTEGAPTQTGIKLVDNLPFGMAVADPPNLAVSGSCTIAAADLKAAAGATTVEVAGAGATAPAGATCAIAVDVVGTAYGNLTNRIPAGGMVSSTGLSNTGPAQATVSVIGEGDVGVSITNNANGVQQGGSTTYVVVATNHGDTDIAGVTLSNTPPAGITYGSWTCTAAGGATCPAASGSGNLSELISLPAGGALTYTITAAVAADLTGSVTNTATLVIPAAVHDTNPGNNSASDTDPVLVRNGEPRKVPTTNPAGLALLGATLIGAAWSIRRKGRKSQG